MLLQYDNECKQVNQILFYYSERASQILAVSTVLFLDETFRFSPEFVIKYFQILLQFIISEGNSVHHLYFEFDDHLVKRNP